MIAFAAVPVVVSLLCALYGPGLARRLPGRAATLFLTVSALTCALATGVALTAWGSLAFVEWRPLGALGHWSAAAVAARIPVPRVVADLCAVVTAGLLAAGVARAVISVLGLLGSAARCRRLAGSADQLVIVDDPEPQAYALAGRPGRIVISRSMLRTLSAPERRALLSHERAHLAGGHVFYPQLTRVAAAANPLLRPLVLATDVAVERWADERAAAELGDSRVVAHALARASLARARYHPLGSSMPAAALSAASTEVRQRVDALLADAPGRRARTASGVALAGLVICALVASVAVGMHVHAIFEGAELARPRR